MDRQPIIDLQGVRKTFGDQVVLDGVNLQVFPKETLVIIGRSGTGKSVTIRHIVGLETPDEGKVFVFGKQMERISKKERDQIRLRLGYLFQSGALLNWLTIEENVELPLLEHRRSMKRSQRMELVHRTLELVDMADASHKHPGEISGGMKKRAALARAIVLQPEVLLYDEPTSGLDPVIASTINELIIETAEKTGATQVVVTHDMESAYRVGDRIAMLYQGKIIAEGTPAEIRRTEDPIVRQFIAGDVHGPITDTEN